MNLTTLEIKTALGKTLKNPTGSNDQGVWTSWCTDSRQKTDGSLFIAIQGENFDAHDYLNQAYENGARGFLVNENIYNQKKTSYNFSATFFLVEDTVDALQKIAKASAAKLKCLKVAITGTSGKTSAKYFSHQMLEGLVPHYFSPKSFNNHIGVPFTLLDLKSEHRLALIEIGMNHPGEISKLVHLAKPNVTAVTMVGRGHLEGVGTIEDVLNEKMCIYEEGQTHIINIDDPRIFKDYQKKYLNNLSNPNFKIIKISLKDKSADIYFNIKNVQFNSFEIEGHIFNYSGKAKINIAGEHHGLNVAIAAAVSGIAGISPEQIWKRFEMITPVWGRSEILKSKNNVSIYFDAYNANPESMKVFLSQTKHLSESPYFILGEMLEMGEHAREVHYELGQLVAQTPHKKVWFIGPSCETFKQGYVSVNKAKEIEEKLIISSTYEQTLALKYQSVLQPQDWVALKASRGIGLEKFLKDFI